jgi:hypothetical protein
VCPEGFELFTHSCPSIPLHSSQSDHQFCRPQRTVLQAREWTDSQKTRIFAMVLLLVFWGLGQHASVVCGSNADLIWGCRSLFSLYRLFCVVRVFFFLTFLLVTFPYIHILYPNLVHLLHYPPSFPTHLLKVTLAGFSVPYSYMYRKYLNHSHPPLSSSTFVKINYYILKTAFFVTVLGSELTALCLLCQCSTTWAILLSFLH